MKKQTKRVYCPPVAVSIPLPAGRLLAGSAVSATGGTTDYDADGGTSGGGSLTGGSTSPYDDGDTFQ